MSNQTYRLSLKSTHEESVKVPDFVTDIQEKASLNEEVASTFMLLLSEAVDNAIQHGNRYDPDKTVSVEINISNTEIRVSVSDDGEGFDPRQLPDNPLKEENLLKPGGRGIFLIEELADSVEFLDGGSTLRFVIRRVS